MKLYTFSLFDHVQVIMQNSYIRGEVWFMIAMRPEYVRTCQDAL